MQELLETDKHHLWHPFTAMQEWCAPGHEPLMLVEGKGCVLRDQHGREYLDGNSSIWTNIHGHQHPVIHQAIAEQLRKVAHTSFLGFTHEPGIRLARELVSLMPDSALTRVFFTDNGSTAIESAVRMALQFWRQNGSPQRDVIVAFDRAYHGDTLGAASLGGIPIFKGSGNDFGYRVVRVSGLDSLAKLSADEVSRIAAVVIEPLIQGAAGMRLWPTGMLAELRAWCTRHDVLLILDEVMTGFGRTGKMFACEHEAVAPDLLCLAKGLTGGCLPLAATLATERVFASFLPPENTFYYGHSYCGSQLGCAAALASLQVFREEHVLESLSAKIDAFAHHLESLRCLPQVMDIRQCGMIAGIEIGPFPSMAKMGAQVCLTARRHGLLTRPVLDTLVLMPPLCMTDAEMERMVTALRLAILETCG